MSTKPKKGTKLRPANRNNFMRYQERLKCSLKIQKLLLNSDLIRYHGPWIWTQKPLRSILIEFIRANTHIGGKIKYDQKQQHQYLDTEEKEDLRLLKQIGIYIGPEILKEKQLFDIFMRFAKEGEKRKSILLSMLGFGATGMKNYQQMEEMKSRDKIIIDQVLKLTKKGDTFEAAVEKVSNSLGKGELIGIETIGTERIKDLFKGKSKRSKDLQKLLKLYKDLILI